MAFKQYNKQLIYRLVALVVPPLTIGWSLASNYSWEVVLLLFGLEIFLVWELFGFLTRTNRQISFFIQAIKNDDTTLRFPVNTGNSIINDLHFSLNELNKVLQQTKLKSQIRERYFSEIIKNIGTGIIVFNAKGFVTEANPAILELTGLQHITHLSQLDRVDKSFREELEKTIHSKKRVITLRKPGELVQLITRSSTFILKDEKVQLVTLQDIRGELERKELDSWVKLIRVLSHEIMNSLAPVTSIAQSLHELWKEKADTEGLIPDKEAIESTVGGLEVIGERGVGLIRFVQSYRLLTKVPVPAMKNVSMKSLFERLSILSSPFKAGYGVTIRFNFPDPDYHVLVDEHMLLQVLINLTKNAAEALAQTPDALIVIDARQKPNQETEITISDNGPGVPEEIADQIFVPFFTTKANGTGIGLSHSRQIMRAHGGTISHNSENGKTVFRLVW
jgi:two-component system, NtrC family, nitrogen regulation sensor histidine kinase NtrY